MATTGEVSRLVSEKGFGFIRVDGSDSVFFHASVLDATGKTYEELEPGDQVELEIADSPRGPRASWVRCTR